MSSKPLIGALFACTIPGSTCAVGAITQIPYTFANQRRSAGSLATPFCIDTTGTATPAVAERSSAAPTVSCDFTPSSTTSSGRKSISAGPPTTGIGSLTSSSALCSRRPCAAIASRCGPRAISTTS